MLTGNRGEWSEVYALFKILAEGNLYPGDAKAKRIPDFFYPVISILKREFTQDTTFLLDGSSVIISDDRGRRISISASTFSTQAELLLSEIKSAKGRAFAIPQIEVFLNSLGSKTLKANSTTKADLIIKVHDSRTNLLRDLGFSIKSQLGGASTLLNASPATNLTFSISGPPLTKQQADSINSIQTSSKIRDRVKCLYELGNQLNFLKAENLSFQNNLVLIDSLLPNIIASAVLGYYQGKAVTLSEVCKHLTLTNPLNFDQTLNHRFYEHKLKRFLSEIALGMMPNTTWNGIYDGTEGYIVIKEDGEIVCYHIINRNLFENYLLENTRIDTPSSSRHGFAVLYQVNDKFHFKLNFQIRFM